MLTIGNKRLRAWPAILATLLIMGSTHPLSAQCTVSEIIDRMVTAAETEQPTAYEGGPSTQAGNDPPVPGDAPVSADGPDFVFQPEIGPAQRQILRRAGQYCSWTSDVTKCTFRRVARMALRGKDAAYIYDKCLD